MRNYILKILFLTLFLLVFSCNKSRNLFYKQGSAVKTTTWRLPLSDSLNVLKAVNGVWRLPGNDQKVMYKKDSLFYKKPAAVKFGDFLGNVDLQVVSSSDSNVIRYYRHKNNSLLLVGFTNPDSTKPLTVFDPPPIIQTDNFDSITTSHTIMKTLRLNEENGKIQYSFGKGLKSKVIITPLKTGYYLDSDGKKHKAHLYKLTISRDAVIQYGKNNLDVPDAVTISSNILVNRNGKLLLEWGIRMIPTDKTENDMIKPDSLYLEIIKYKTIK